MERISVVSCGWIFMVLGRIYSNICSKRREISIISFAFPKETFVFFKFVNSRFKQLFSVAFKIGDDKIQLCKFNSIAFLGNIILIKLHRDSIVIRNNIYARF